MDYSKWDNIGSDLSDDEPGSVIRLKKPSSITIGKHGYSINQKTDKQTSRNKIKKKKKIKNASKKSPKPIKKSMNVDYSKWDHFGDELSESDQSDNLPDSDRFENQYNPANKKKESNSEHIQNIPNPQKINLSEEHSTNLSEEQLTDNGGYTGKSASYCDCLWSQSHDEVIVSIPLPKETRAKAVSIRLFPGLRRGGIEEKPRLFVGLSEKLNSSDNIKLLIDTELAHHVEIEEDDGTFTDWELKNTNKGRVVRITMIKKLGVGMNAAGAEGVGRVVLWWSELFVGSTKIDVTKIKGRDMKKQKQYANAWQKANELFQEKIQKHNKIDINS